MANKSFRGDFDFAQIAELWYEQKNDFLSNVTLFLSILGSIGVSEQDNTLQPSQPTNIHHYWDCVPECFYLRISLSPSLFLSASLSFF